LDIADLVTDAGAAVYRNDAGTFQVARETLQVLADLHAQLTRRRQDQTLDRAVLGVQEFQHGQSERGGLAGSRLGQCHHILLALQQQGYGLFLYRGGCGEADLNEGTEGFGT